jgi:predicted alpha-1,2-mannosidase
MKLKSILFTILGTGIIFAQSNYTKYVDPFIGTGGHGHTFPGATMPFGMVQLSPDTDIRGWDWCSGYHYSDSSVMGFSHTHLSGTGAADYGDILLMPVVGGTKWQPGEKSDPDEGYRSRFSHERESARPGYYQVFLDDYNINVELTATKRTGMHQYTFPESNQSGILIDLQHGISDRVRESYLQVVSGTEIEGLRRSRGWASDQYLFFVIRFSKPFNQCNLAVNDSAAIGERADGRNVKGLVRFKTKKDEIILAKVGISAVSVEGARKNLDAENPDWNFAKIAEIAETEWNKWLSKIQIEDKIESKKTVFYTALYHTLVSPNLYMDVDGQYRGRDLEIHKAENFNYYTLFSLWDTFRATHPLFTLIAPEHNRDFIRTMILQYEQGSDLPIWELSANETGTMIGYHSVPVIVDAFMKGQRDFDADKAMEAMKHSSMRDYRGLEQYRNFGFIPSEQEENSVSKCLEYAYDDWCIATMAKERGRTDDYVTYIKRSQYFYNQFDPETGFMRGRLANGLWRSPFDPRQVSHLGNADFTEGNSWQYTFFVPHNVNALMQLMGGKDAFVNKLDQLFSEGELFGLEHTPDISGLIGNYAHGNEPSHHIAYLYNYAGNPWKTQELIHRIKNEMYTDQPDGLAGNEDCGQMSAWYVFSAMGFYPVAPGEGRYVIGTPDFDKVTLNLADGRKTVITADRKSESDFYIQGIELNGKSWSKNYIIHSNLMDGAKITFKMSDTKNVDWGSDPADCIKSFEIEEPYKTGTIDDYRCMPPYFRDEETLFAPDKMITLSTTTPDAEIRYTLDGSNPEKHSELYNGPFKITKSVQLNAKTFKSGMEPSAVYKRQFTRIGFSAGDEMTVTLNFPPHERYNNGGADALFDKKIGTENFRDGRWLGFRGDDLDVVVDFKKQMNVSGVGARFLQAHGAWILFPDELTCYYSNDGINFDTVSAQNIPIPETNMPDAIKQFDLKFDPVKARFLRIVAKNPKKLPRWHGTPGGDSWIFCDEIMIDAK